ncbi:MAG: TIGR00266 family protein [Acidobacteria bacterium]|nr:TIGR00266 family protein [Acidobacteriota bacterium]
MAIGGHQVGPVAQDEILSNLRNGSIDADTLVFTSGMTTWQKVRDAPAFASFVGAGALAGSTPPPPAPGRRAHDIDFVIHGNEMQFVEVELDPGEAAVAEAGVFMYMTPGIQMETLFGDGSHAPRGVLDALLGAGKRLLTGESLFMTVFQNRAQSKQRVAFAAPYPGKILAMDLKAIGGQLICQKDSFLCAARGVSIGIAFQKKIGVGLFGGEGFIMQRLDGDGLCFVHAGGMVHLIDLGPGETLRVDTGCLVALQPSVSYDIQFVGRIKTALFGGEGIFFATLTGPGRVWLQSLPLSRMADRIYAAAPQTGKGRKEEGSVLDRAFGLGDLIDGR